MRNIRPRILLLTARAFVIPQPRHVTRFQTRVKVGVHPRGKLDVLGTLAPEWCFRTATPAKKKTIMREKALSHVFVVFSFFFFSFHERTRFSFVTYQILGDLRYTVSSSSTVVAALGTADSEPEPRSSTTRSIAMLHRKPCSSVDRMRCEIREGNKKRRTNNSPTAAKSREASYRRAR